MAKTNKPGIDVGAAYRSRSIMMPLLLLNAGCILAAAGQAPRLAEILNRAGAGLQAASVAVALVAFRLDRRRAPRSVGAQVRRWFLTLAVPAALASFLPLGIDFAIGTLTGAVLLVINGLVFGLAWSK